MMFSKRKLCFCLFFQKNCAKENTKTQVFKQFFVSWKSNNKECKHNERTHKERTNREEVKRKVKRTNQSLLRRVFFFLNRNKEIKTKETRYFSKRD